jgi:tripartite-type tricarboxylate transporter receptor subunit TctC
VIFTGDAAKNRAELLCGRADGTYDQDVNMASIASIWARWRARSGNIVVPGHDIPMLIRGTPGVSRQARGGHESPVRRRPGHHDHDRAGGKIGRLLEERTMPKIRSLLIGAAGLVLALIAPAVAAEDYPNRPVRLIIPFPPGGSNDVVARMVATQLGERLGKQIVVDNRAGAGGTIGTEVASRAAPDGYTLLVVSIAHAVSPALYKVNYDPVKSFTPVSILASGPNVLALNPEFPPTSVKELIALAKQKPGEIHYASAGIGSFQHLSGELFKLMAGINVVHVPFKGGGPSMVDVIAGHTKYLLASLVQATGHIKSGKLRAIGTSGSKRNPALPEVPTIAEAGVPGYEATNWWGIVAPAGTPPPIVGRLHKELAIVLNADEIKNRFASQGASVVQMSSAEFAKFIESELSKWAKVVKDANIKAQ